MAIIEVHVLQDTSTNQHNNGLASLKLDTGQEAPRSTIYMNVKSDPQIQQQARFLGLLEEPCVASPRPMIQGSSNSASE